MKVSIGIPAHNEEANIRQLINSILAQANRIHRVDEILVVSDGSTDRTAEIVKSFPHNGIKLVEHTDRKGKPARLNELLQNCTGDIVVLFDADVILENEFTLHNLIKPFYEAPNVGLVAGRPIPAPATSFFRKVMDASFFLQDFIKRKLNHGSNVYAVHGRIVALKQSLAKHLTIPHDITGTDAYLYFAAVDQKYTVRFAEKALARYQNPGNLGDFTKQARRFNNTQEVLKQHFAFDIAPHFVIPMPVKVQALILLFLTHHIYALAYITLKVYAHFSVRKKVDAVWETTDSTKRL